MNDHLIVISQLVSCGHVEDFFDKRQVNSFSILKEYFGGFNEKVEFGQSNSHKDIP